MHSAVDHSQLNETMPVTAAVAPSAVARSNADGPRILARGAAKIAAMMASNGCRVKPGATLIAPNVDDEFVYRVRSGWLAQSHIMPDGRYHYVHIFLTGDVFHISALFNPQQSDCVTAITEAAIESVHRRELLHAVLRDGDVSARCLWDVLEQGKRLERSVVSLGRRSAKERLCLLLWELRDRLRAAGCLPMRACTFEMPLTQLQLSTHLGLTPVHINRVLKELRVLGVLQIGRGQATIMDLEALQHHANL